MISIIFFKVYSVINNSSCKIFKKDNKINFLFNKYIISQILIVLSQELEITIFPQGEKLTLETYLVCPSKF